MTGDIFSLALASLERLSRELENGGAKPETLAVLRERLSLVQDVLSRHENDNQEGAHEYRVRRWYG
jgi:hypothetical protein